MIPDVSRRSPCSRRRLRRGDHEQLCSGARSQARHTSPYFHRFKLGDAEVTVVSDGPLPLGDPSGTFIGVPKEDVQKLLSDNFSQPHECRAGAKRADREFWRQDRAVRHRDGHVETVWPDDWAVAKRVFPNPASSRKTSTQWCVRMPTSITSAVLSMKAGSRYSRMRRSTISQADLEFWTDEKKQDGPPQATSSCMRARTWRCRSTTASSSSKTMRNFPAAGVTALSAPGHTFGHHMFMIQSAAGNHSAFLGDLTHHQVLLLEKPRMEFAYDSDSEKWPRQLG